MIWTCLPWSSLVPSLLLSFYGSSWTMETGKRPTVRGHCKHSTNTNVIKFKRGTCCFVYSDRYDVKDTSKITLVDLQFICAMGPPGGGRNAVTSRFLRHFNIFSINPFSDDTMVHIFSNIMAFYLKNNAFSPECFTVGNQIVTATMEVSYPLQKYPFFSIFFSLQH